MCVLWPGWLSPVSPASGPRLVTGDHPPAVRQVPSQWRGSLLLWDGISQGQVQRVIHFMLSPGPRCRHLLHYLCCQVFYYISCHLFCYSRNLWRLQRLGQAWELMGTGATTGLYKHETGGGGSDGCDMPRCQLCHVWHFMTFPDTGEYWPGSTWCLWGHPSRGASFSCQSHPGFIWWLGEHFTQSYCDCEAINGQQ